MDLRKGKETKASSTPSNSKKLPTKTIESSDHWAFLEEMEAPMWADLTLEVRFMEQDIDDAWFRISHPVHQMPSRQLKKSFSHCDKERRLSSEVPDSVSRSRGKHYKSRRWIVNEQDHSSGKHPVRKLGGGNLGTTMEKIASRSSSTSTVTVSSSCRKPSSILVHPSKKSVAKSTFIAMGSSSSSSVVSKPKSLSHKSNAGGRRSISHATRATYQMSNKSCAQIHRNTRSSTSEVNKGIEVLQHRKSSAGKSSVGSSCNLTSILENANSDEMLKVERDEISKKESGNHLYEKQVKDGISCLQHKVKSERLKLVDQESKSKVLGLTSRKPLCSLNAPRIVKGGVKTKPGQIEGVANRKPVAVNNKENIIKGKLQCPDAVDRIAKIRNGFLNTSKGKPIGGNHERCSIAVIQRTMGKSIGGHQERSSIAVVERTYFK